MVLWSGQEGRYSDLIIDLENDPWSEHEVSCHPARVGELSHVAGTRRARLG